MSGENWLRDKVRKDSSRILYEDERYMIGTSSIEQDSHNLVVNNAYAYLDRGIFNELARADVKRLRSSLSMVAEEVLNEMLTKNIPLEELGWALAKAAIKDREDFASYLVEQRESV